MVASIVLSPSSARKKVSPTVSSRPKRAWGGCASSASVSPRRVQRPTTMDDSPASRCSQKTGRAIPAASPMPTEKRCTTSRRAEHTGEHGPRGNARGKGQRDELGLIAHLGHEYEEQGHPKSRHRVLLGNKAPQGEPLLHAECMAAPVDRGRGELVLS